MFLKRGENELKYYIKVIFNHFVAKFSDYKKILFTVSYSVMVGVNHP